MKVSVARVTLFVGRRTPYIPAGSAYAYRRWGLMHPTRSIAVALLGPVFVAVAVGPA